MAYVRHWLPKFATVLIGGLRKALAFKVCRGWVCNGNAGSTVYEPSILTLQSTTRGPRYGHCFFIFLHSLTVHTVRYSTVLDVFHHHFHPSLYPEFSPPQWCHREGLLPDMLGGHGPAVEQEGRPLPPDNQNFSLYQHLPAPLSCVSGSSSFSSSIRNTTRNCPQAKLPILPYSHIPTLPSSSPQPQPRPLHPFLDPAIMSTNGNGVKPHHNQGNFLFTVSSPSCIAARPCC